MSDEGNAPAPAHDGLPPEALWERRIALGLGLAIFALYVITAAPGLYWLDSGELTTAAFQLGTAHPSGYPLHSLFGKGFSLFPVGSVAFRLTLLSAVAGAVTVSLVFLLAYRVATSVDVPPLVARIAAVTGALLMGLSHGFYRQATVTEVYTLAATAAVGSLLLFWHVLRKRDPRWELLLAFVAGLAALGSHPDYRILILPVLGVAWILRLRRGGRHTRAVPAIFGLGALVVVYLVAVAGHGRVPDWGHCTTFSALWDHVMARRIRGADFSALMFSLRGDVVSHHLRLAWEILAGPFIGIALPLCLVGAGRLLTRPGSPRILGIALLWAGVGDFVYSFWINPMGLSDLQNGTTFALAVSILAALGLSTTAGWIAQKSRRLAPAVAASLALMAVLPTALDNGQEKLYGAGYGAAAWTDAALDQAPARALVLTTSDNLSAGLVYAQQVEGARPDVLALVRQHLWVAHDLQSRLRLDDDVALPWGSLREYLGRPRAARIRGRLNLLAQILAAVRGRRAVLWEPGDGVDLPAVGQPLIPAVPLFRVPDPKVWKPGPGRASGTARGKRLPEPSALVLRVRRILHDDTGDQAARVRSHVFNALGMQYLRVRRDPGVLNLAQELFRLALRAWPQSAAARINGGVVLARRAERAAKAGRKAEARRLLTQAVEVTERALRRAPNRYVGLMNAGRYRLRLAELSGPADAPPAKREAARARTHFERAARLFPERAGPRFNLGVLAARVQHYREARRHLRAAVARNPRDAAAQLYLKRVEDALRRAGH